MVFVQIITKLAEPAQPAQPAQRGSRHNRIFRSLYIKLSLASPLPNKEASKMSAKNWPVHAVLVIVLALGVLRSSRAQCNLTQCNNCCKGCCGSICMDGVQCQYGEAYCDSGDEGCIPACPSCPIVLDPFDQGFHLTTLEEVKRG